jgi:hypothetical protein
MKTKKKRRKKRMEKRKAISRTVHQLHTKFSGNKLPIYCFTEPENSW